MKDELQASERKRLAASERKRLAAFVQKLGIVEASKAIGCNRSTIANALARLPIQAGTIVLITSKLKEKYHGP